MFKVLPNSLSLFGPLCTVGVVVYFNLMSYASIHHALQHVKMFLDHKWLATGEFNISYLIYYLIYL